MICLASCLTFLHAAFVYPLPYLAAVYMAMLITYQVSVSSCHHGSGPPLPSKNNEKNIHCRTHRSISHTHIQLILQVMYKEVTFANNMMDFITGFNITIETIKEFVPHLSHRLDDFFYDAKSFAEAYLSRLPSALLDDHYLPAEFHHTVPIFMLVTYMLLWYCILLFLTLS